MIQRVLHISLFLLFGVSLTAQDFPESFKRNEVGLNLYFLIDQFFPPEQPQNLNLGDFGKVTPGTEYYFTYKRNYGKTKWRFGAGFHSKNSIDSVVIFIGVAPEYITREYQQMNFRMGFESRNFDYRNWWLAAGIDFLYERGKVKEVHTYENFIFGNPPFQRITEDRILTNNAWGIAPILVFGYQFRPNFSISTEMALNILQNNRKYTTMTSDDPHGGSEDFSTKFDAWIQPPLAIFMNLHF